MLVLSDAAARRDQNTKTTARNHTILREKKSKIFRVGAIAGSYRDTSSDDIISSKLRRRAHLYGAAAQRPDDMQLVGDQSCRQSVVNPPFALRSSVHFTD